MLKPGEFSVYHQRKYLVDNPGVLEEVLSICPSYIFFKVTTDEPLGVKNIPLTENRSLATDYRIYKEYGILNFVQAVKPVRNASGDLEHKAFSRFFINQDTGGAIKGNARSDLYFGYGPEAATVANNLKKLGKQYFLIKKSK
jgi:membrane-bound lytic murein transglycosylase A